MYVSPFICLVLVLVHVLVLVPPISDRNLSLTLSNLLATRIQIPNLPPLTLSSSLTRNLNLSRCSHLSLNFQSHRIPTHLFPP